MRKKRDNNLVVLNYDDGEKKYYTSLTRAGLVVGLSSASVIWALNHNNTIEDLSGRKLTFSIVDGSEIQYKYINN